jgi:CDP-diacylglycerol--glycerol-3-phosphate 3-phosphatidyltransferase
MRHLPNLLTILRIILTPIILWILFDERVFGNQFFRVFFLVALYVGASLTDYFDGYLSRKYQTVSRFGEFLDPLADKLFVISVYLSFAYLPFIALPISFILAIIIREVVITALRIYALAQKRVMKTEKHGKMKTVLQIVSQSSVLLVLLIYSIVAETAPFKLFFATETSGTGVFTSVHRFLVDFHGFPDSINLFLHYFPIFTLAITCAWTLFSGYSYLKNNWELLFSGKKA